SGVPARFGQFGKGGGNLRGRLDQRSVGYDFPGRRGRSASFPDKRFERNGWANGAVVNQGTILRIDLAVSETRMPQIQSITEIGSGFSERTDPAALVIGPTGVGLSPGCEEEGDGCVLYIADSLNNRIGAIFNPLRRRHSAGTGLTVSSGGSLNDSARPYRCAQRAYSRGERGRRVHYGNHSRRQADSNRSAGQHGRTASGKWNIIWRDVRPRAR